MSRISRRDSRPRPAPDDDDGNRRGEALVFGNIVYDTGNPRRD